jgi:hypothetical protein
MMDGRTDRQTDRQTDMTKLIVAFSNFANEPKNSTWCPRKVYMFLTDLRKNSDLLPYTTLTDRFCITDVESLFKVGEFLLHGTH